MSVALELRRTSGTQEVLGESPDLEATLRPSSGRRLVCRACGEPVTADGERISIEGRHVHWRINPAGFQYEIGCFRTASGAVVVGEPTTEFAWFVGYSWVYSICGGCGTHLGWLFEGGESGSFHGLILNRLEAEDSAQPQG
ncbi:MAG: hypothetical protein GY856_37745 [bacterium]|nr:hypothetical protein [bacterium]